MGTDVLRILDRLDLARFDFGWGMFAGPADGFFVLGGVWIQGCPCWGWVGRGFVRWRVSY